MNPDNSPKIEEGRLNTFAKKLEHEVLELLPPTIFFFIVFHILAFSRALMLRQYGISISASAGATIGALIVAKVILLSDLLPFVNLFPKKPLIYNILWKTMIYVVAAILVHYLEHLIPVWWRIGDLAAANRTLYEEMIWPHFWALQLWMLILLFVYCTSHEFVHAIGPHEVKKLLFGPSAKSGS
jgi:hypothetical protein